jgi:hypothetical protein
MKTVIYGSRPDGQASIVAQLAEATGRFEPEERETAPNERIRMIRVPEALRFQRPTLPSSEAIER